MKQQQQYWCIWRVGAHRFLPPLHPEHAQQYCQINSSIDPTTDDIYLQLFEGLFPANFLDKMVTEINKKISGDPVTYGELLKWIGLWVLMSTVNGSD